MRYAYDAFEVTVIAMRPASEELEEKVRRETKLVRGGLEM